jgi:hypothetical protein
MSGRGAARSRVSIVSHWEFVRSYVIQDGHLFLALMADGGIHEFEPIAETPATPRR